MIIPFILNVWSTNVVESFPDEKRDSYEKVKKFEYDLLVATLYTHLGMKQPTKTDNKNEPEGSKNSSSYNSKPREQ